eukprot:scaffold66880_cov35-Cyclotella_meneghiniana.AAC.1
MPICESIHRTSQWRSGKGFCDSSMVRIERFQWSVKTNFFKKDLNSMVLDGRVISRVRVYCSMHHKPSEDSKGRMKIQTQGTPPHVLTLDVKKSSITFKH